MGVGGLLAMAARVLTDFPVGEPPALDAVGLLTLTVEMLPPMDDGVLSGIPAGVLPSALW